MGNTRARNSYSRIDDRQDRSHHQKRLYMRPTKPTCTQPGRGMFLGNKAPMIAVAHSRGFRLIFGCSPFSRIRHFPYFRRRLLACSVTFPERSQNANGAWTVLRRFLDGHGAVNAHRSMSTTDRVRHRCTCTQRCLIDSSGPQIPRS